MSHDEKVSPASLSTDKDSINKADGYEHHETTVVPKTPDQRQAELSAALAVDPGVKSGSWRSIRVGTHWQSSPVPADDCMQFYLIVLCIMCCSGDTGFDGTVMSGINA